MWEENVERNGPRMGSWAWGLQIIVYFAQMPTDVVALSRWFYDRGLDLLDCNKDKQLDLVFVEPPSKLRSSIDPVMELMLRCKPLLGNLIPGDFPVSTYEGAELRVLLSVGMKLNSVQIWMREHPPSSDDTQDLVFKKAPRSDASVASHGDVPYCTGPTPFMKQARIIHKKHNSVYRE